MNKIERAISDIKSRLEDRKLKNMCLAREVSVLEDVLETLENIQRNNSIPHVEVIPNVVITGNESYKTFNI